jgi:murein DD-endopeptidase MepM/ murein hydrolase activator NlpD
MSDLIDPGENKPSTRMNNDEIIPDLLDQPRYDSIESYSGSTDEQEASLRRWQRFSEWSTRAGLGDLIFRLGTHALLLATILVAAWGLREFYQNARPLNLPSQAAYAAPLPTATPTELPLVLPEFQQDQAMIALERFTELHTDVPSRPRQEVITYTVEIGDTLFGIAEKFGLLPETLLWANQLTLGDNPHSLRPGQTLNILPVNGTYHRWSEGDGLNGVAEFFQVKPEDIINFPANHLDAETIGDWSRPNIPAGTWLVIPGGKRSFVSWSLPPGGIPRDNPTVAKGFGSGVCGAKVEGVVGAGVFVWPAPNHKITGFNWSPETNHSGVDIDGDLGHSIFAADNGVVVYAGWNNWGYGNVVVINHGNGWQTLYAHLDSILVGCGQSVWQGNVIGAMGSTGNSTGPHLHFEMMYNGVKVNPNDYLP